MAPKPPTLVAPRRSRGAPRIRAPRIRVGRLPRGGVEEAARSVDVAHEIGAGVLDGLVGADRAPALHARLGVSDGQLEDVLGRADQLGGARERSRAQRGLEWLASTAGGSD